MVVGGREEKRGGKTTIGGGKWEAQTMGYKTGLRMYCMTWGIEPIFCDTYKKKLTFNIVYKF